MFALLVGVLLFALSGALKSLGLMGKTADAAKPSEQPSAASQPPGALMTAAASKAEPSRSPEGSSAPSYTASDLRDPLTTWLPALPGERRMEEPEAVQLPEPDQPAAVREVQGVWMSGSQASVIIDGDVYQVGDAIGGGTITAIDRNGLTIERGGRTEALPFERSSDGAWQWSSGTMSPAAGLARGETASVPSAHAQRSVTAPSPSAREVGASTSGAF